MPNLRNFEFNSKYPMDNVCFVYEGTIVGTIYGGAGGYSATINHNLGFKPLGLCYYSVDNGITWNDLDISFYTNIGWGMLTSYTDRFEVDMNISQDAPASIKVRIFAFTPSNQNPVVLPPTPLSRFFLNTNFGYDSLIAKGVVTIPANTSNFLVYQHNLGYIPKVLMWEEIGDELSRINDGFENASWTGETSSISPYISTTSLTFTNYSSLSSSPFTLHYRIYGGQNA